MKSVACIIWAILYIISVQAQNKPFDVSSIPEELKKNAYSVVREEKIEFEVRSIDKAVFKVHKVVTVLNENGRDELVFQEQTDQFRSLEGASIQVFDSKGNFVHKYKRNDLASQIAGEGLVPDGKVYYLRVPAAAFPITIQYDNELKFTGLINYPQYHLQVPEQSVENSTFIVTVPVELDLKYKVKNYKLEPLVNNDGKSKSYTWSVTKLPALEYEEGSVSAESRYPSILLTPGKFALDGYEGDLSSWQNFGKWYGLLTKNTINLSPERKQFFQGLVKAATNDREKVSIIYKYLQTNCRYVLIALGIGGYKPFDADFVDKKKYGDCKALSNYTQACLDAVGIKSYPALINAEYNKEPVDPLFPYNAFNHVIVCVPMQKDTIWLECTSNTSEFGVLGSFTENRNALLITGDGGKLVATPKSKASDNVFSSSSIIDFAGDGSGMVKVSVNTTGEYRQLMNYLTAQKRDDQKDYLVNYFGYIQPDDFEIKNDKAASEALTTMNMIIARIPEFTAGKKMFLNPRLYKISEFALPKTEKRTLDYYFRHPFIKTDTTVYKLPDGFEIETMPKGKQIKFDYGSFTTSYEFNGNDKTIRSIAKLELDEYKIPAAKFTVTQNFFNQVLEEYTEKIVIKHL